MKRTPKRIMNRMSITILLVLLIAGALGLTLFTRAKKANAEVAAGNRLFAAQDYEAALQHYTAAQSQAPGQAEPLYNAANVFYKQQALDKALVPIRSFMLKQTNKNDLNLFIGLSKSEKPKTLDDIPTEVVIPAFITSELRRAFLMGFLIFLPFLIIDMVVSSVLMSMGMVMLPPVMISLPFKLILFVLVDGWGLIIKSLIISFN
jgi:flagellar biosynthesis protein FliP